MTPVETAAVISGCFATGSVGHTAYVAIRGFWSTREATTRAIEAASDDTRRTLSAAREERIWEKRSTAYQETVAYLLYRQERRSFRPFSHITGRDLGTAMRFWFGAYQPPGWSELQGRLVAYASDAVVAAYKESGAADSEARHKFDAWQTAYDQARGNPLTGDDPAEGEAKDRLFAAERAAREKDQELIDLIRSELLRPPAALGLLRAPNRSAAREADKDRSHVTSIAATTDKRNARLAGAVSACRPLAELA